MKNPKVHPHIMVSGQGILGEVLVQSSKMLRMGTAVQHVSNKFTHD
ncbi:hypothetical protein [Serratia quinivorans]